MHFWLESSDDAGIAQVQSQQALYLLQLLRQPPVDGFAVEYGFSCRGSCEVSEFHTRRRLHALWLAAEEQRSSDREFVAGHALQIAQQARQLFIWPVRIFSQTIGRGQEGAKHRQVNILQPRPRERRFVVIKGAHGHIHTANLFARRQALPRILANITLTPLRVVGPVNSAGQRDLQERLSSNFNLFNESRGAGRNIVRQNLVYALAGAIHIGHASDRIVIFNAQPQHAALCVQKGDKRRGQTLRARRSGLEFSVHRLAALHGLGNLVRAHRFFLISRIHILFLRARTETQLEPPPPELRQHVGITGIGDEVLPL